MARPLTELTMVQKIQARKAFLAGASAYRITALLGMTQPVWERALRRDLGDEAFEAQLAKNRAAPAKGQAPALRPAVRQGLEKLRKRGAPAAPAPAPTARQVAAKQALKAQRVARMNAGEVVPVVCVDSGQAFGSMTAAARALGIPKHQVQRALRKPGYQPPNPAGGPPLQLRRWREGDPPVVVGRRGQHPGTPIRLDDGRSWPSISALADELQADSTRRNRFSRWLRKQGYGPDSAPLDRQEALRILSEEAALLDRSRKIAKGGCPAI